MSTDADGRTHPRPAELEGLIRRDHYLNAARVEQATYDSVVHAGDRERYIERG